MLISPLRDELVDMDKLCKLKNLFSKYRQPFWIFRNVCGHLFGEYFSANGINVFTHFLLNVFTFPALQRNSSTTKASGLSRRRVIKPNWIPSNRNTCQCVPALQLISTAWSLIGQKTKLYMALSISDWSSNDESGIYLPSRFFASSVWLSIFLFFNSEELLHLYFPVLYYWSLLRNLNSKAIIRTNVSIIPCIRPSINIAFSVSFLNLKNNCLPNLATSTGFPLLENIFTSHDFFFVLMNSSSLYIPQMPAFLFIYFFAMLGNLSS